MKSKIFLALVFLSASLCADTPPAVEVINPSQILIAGQPSGSIVDALANGADRAAMLDAVVKWEHDIGESSANAISAVQSAKAAERTAVDTILSQALAAELSTGDGPVAARIRAIQAAIANARQ